MLRCKGSELRPNQVLTGLNELCPARESSVADVGIILNGHRFKVGNIMDAWLQCEIGQGQFSFERAVQGRRADGREFSLFAPEESVKSQQSTSSATRFVPGRVRVRVVDRLGERAVVRLPAEAFEDGYLVTVSTRDLKEAIH